MTETTPMITGHCVDRYLERIAPPALRRRPEAEARRLAYLELYCALSQEPVCRLTTAAGKTLLGVTNPAGYTFIVLLADGDHQAQTCGPRWYWHESRRHFRALGYRCSKGRDETRAAARERRLARRAQEAIAHAGEA